MEFVAYDGATASTSKISFASRAAHRAVTSRSLAVYQSLNAGLSSAGSSSTKTQAFRERGSGRLHRRLGLL